MLTLQAGGLVNAFGNGMVIPFMFIYLHNLRGIGPRSRAAVTRAPDAEPRGGVGLSGKAPGLQSRTWR